MPDTVNAVGSDPAYSPRMAAVGRAAPPRVWNRLVEDLRELPGIELRRSQFGAVPAVWVDGREFVHLDKDGSVDIRLTRVEIRGRRDVLGEDERVYFRRSSSADWVHVVTRGNEDVAFLVELARIAAEANRRS